MLGQLSRRLRVACCNVNARVVSTYQQVANANPVARSVKAPCNVQRLVHHLRMTCRRSVHEVLRSPGQPLDATTRAFMEPHFGHDFSGVRVHTDVKAAESARAVNALAYTVGSDVVFGNGHYVPQSNEGRRLMAHELTHVVQQGGILAGAYVGNITPADHASEREAQHMARMVQTDTQQQIAHQHSRPALAVRKRAKR